MAAVPTPGGPGAFGYAGLGGALAGGIVGAIGAANTASGQAAAYEAEAKGYEADAAAAGQTGANIWGANARQDQQANYQANELIGRQRAAYGAANVNPASGSPLDVLADTKAEVRTAAMNRFYTAQTRAQAAGQQYTLDEQNAAAARSAAATARESGTLGIISSVLSGGAKALPFLAAL